MYPALQFLGTRPIKTNTTTNDTNLVILRLCNGVLGLLHRFQDIISELSSPWTNHAAHKVWISAKENTDPTKALTNSLQGRVVSGVQGTSSTGFKVCECSVVLRGAAQFTARGIYFAPNAASKSSNIDRLFCVEKRHCWPVRMSWRKMMDSARPHYLSLALGKFPVS